MTSIPINRPQRATDLDQHYRILEVTQGSYTDYYVFRIIRTSEGAVVAVHTMQKDEASPMDWNGSHVWEFIDSLEMKDAT